MDNPFVNAGMALMFFKYFAGAHNICFGAKNMCDLIEAYSRFAAT
jgi:hypothetical protein